MIRGMDRIAAQSSRQDFEARRILVTAGPTVEDIDPVRFISNRSSGRMGVALATAAAQRGADVLCIHGPLAIAFPPNPSIETRPIRSAAEMSAAVMAAIDSFDVAILAAAVADYTPARNFNRKIKKGADEFSSIQVKPTADILASIGELEKRPYLVGFAAESENLIENARAKLKRKKCDMICANPISGNANAFGAEYNQVVILDSNGNTCETECMSKLDLAHAILDRILNTRIS